MKSCEHLLYIHKKKNRCNIAAVYYEFSIKKKKKKFLGGRLFDSIPTNFLIIISLQKNGQSIFPIGLFSVWIRIRLLVKIEAERRSPAAAAAAV